MGLRNPHTLDKAVQTVKDRLRRFTAEASQDRQTLENRLADPAYKKVVGPAGRILQILRALDGCDLETIPLQELKENLSPAVVNATDLLIGIMSLRVTPEQLNANGTGIADNLYVRVMPHVVYSRAMSEGTEFTKANEYADKVKQVHEEAKKVLADAMKIREDVRSAAVQAGISKEAIHFKELATSNHRASLFWGALIALFAGGGFWYAFCYLPLQLAESLKITLTNGQLAQLIVNKALVVSLILFLAGWAARNFSASRHNVVTNRHRQAALSTFETIVNGVKDDLQARDAILVYAAQAIFSPVASGYGKNETDGLSHPIVDLVTTIRRASEPKVSNVN